MHEQATDTATGYRVSSPLVAEEVEIVPEGHRRDGTARMFVVRREPHPDTPGAFLTEVIRDDIGPGNDYGDTHRRLSIGRIRDDGRPLEQLAREWAATHHLDRWAA